MIVIFAKLALMDGQIVQFPLLFKTQTSQKLLNGILAGFI
jgi:hypothetical protein